MSARPDTAARGPSWGWTLAALACIAFGVMAIEFNLALRAGQVAWWARVQALATGEAYSFGAGSAHGMYPVYHRALAAMSSHTALGGGALALAVLQFVPGLRRRHPRLHRATGALVIAAVAASMGGALLYLARTPLATIYASPAFGLALWALALACLGYLSLAVLAARRRDFRSHMGFMALMMAALLTAPLLRFEWAWFGALTGYDMHEVNQGVVPSLVVLCNLAMFAWMHGVGVRDLPPRPRALLPGLPLLTLMAWLAVAVIAHEALLAPWGADALGAWRGAAARLPRSAAPWGLAAIALAWRAPRALARLVAGEGMTRADEALSLAVAAGALLLAADLPRAPADVLGLRWYWTFLGLLLPALLLAARLSRRADQPWSIAHLALALAPAAWPPLWWVALACGQDFVVATWFAATVGLAALSSIAFLTAFGIRLPFGAARAA